VKHLAFAIALAGCAHAPPKIDPPEVATSELFTAALEPAGSGLRASIATRGGFHVNLDYPTAFTPDATPDASFPGTRLPLAEGQERTPCASNAGETCGLSASVPFEPRRSGPIRIGGVLAFSLCDPERCLIEEVRVAATVLGRPGASSAKP
jgi:hypothetical protein